MTELRPYQSEAKAAALSVLQKQDKTFLRIPTGGGKTICSASIAHDLMNDGASILVLQHREEIAIQNLQAFERTTGAKCTVVKGDQDDWSGEVVFGSVATIRGERLSTSRKFSHIFIDECHRAHATTYQDIIEHNDGAKVLGLTATPDRKTFNTFGLPAYHISIERLIQLGYLVRPKGRAIDLGVAGELAKLTGNDAAVASQAAKRLNVDVLNDAVVEGWLSEARDLKTILFASSVDHACAIRDSFTNHGVMAQIITGDTPSKERQSIIARFECGAFPVLINCMVLTEGTDIPDIESVAIARPMKSKILFVQAVGRGLRLAEGKKDALVLDYVGACEAHGGLEMALGVKETQAQRRMPMKDCPKCSELVAAAKRKCPACGEKFPIEPKSKVVVSKAQFKDVEFDTRSPDRWHPPNEEKRRAMARAMRAIRSPRKAALRAQARAEIEAELREMAKIMTQ